MKTKKYIMITVILGVPLILSVWGLGNGISREGNNSFSEGVKYSNRGEYEKAVEIFESILEKENDNSAVQLALGIAYLNMKQPDSAFEHIEISARLDPQRKKTLFILARLYEKNDQISKAVKTWRKFLDLTPETKYKKIAERHLKRLSEHDKR